MLRKASMSLPVAAATCGERGSKALVRQCPRDGLAYCFPAILTSERDAQLPAHRFVIPRHAGIAVEDLVVVLQPNATWSGRLDYETTADQVRHGHTGPSFMLRGACRNRPVRALLGRRLRLRLSVRSSQSESENDHSKSLSWHAAPPVLHNLNCILRAATGRVRSTAAPHVIGSRRTALQSPTPSLDLRV
jgi:hypothetical protein